MPHIDRDIRDNIQAIIELKKSVLLLGPRQTGKTTLLKDIPHDLCISFIKAKHRLRYEANLELLDNEIRVIAEETDYPLVIIDEVQKIPAVMDVVQDLIDDGIAQFILTGSSARKLKRQKDINLLPGRVIPLYMYPLSIKEINKYKEIDPSQLDALLSYGMLPEIYLSKTFKRKEILLDAYVNLYLEEEVRNEAIVRNLGNFSRFLELAASESGYVVNYSKLAQVIGVSHTTIKEYYQILEDCLVAERIEPYLKSKTRHKLTKSQKYLLFDLGLRRVAAHEGENLSIKQKGHLFEQFIGLELIKMIRQQDHKIQIHFWRDLDGPEVDWLIETPDCLIPIEVKYTDKPSERDARHLKTFLKEYDKASKAYIICQTPRKLKLAENIYAIPWLDMYSIFPLEL